MKKSIVISILLSLFILPGTLHANSLNDAQTACEMVLCLYGEKNGTGEMSECNSVMDEYRKIVKKNKITKTVLCVPTIEMRVSKLLACPQDEYDVRQLVDCD